ncbi:glycosyltransferase family 2 protein [Vibrio parahaemolyticus]|uniref:glycosyltransferase family 2 protein n=1 Tax=Vibrio parahaemolyticus TaxID=670 RepID=UPI0024338483|nr:glycosyltransferase family 2 protein [Vibrio parahaemolyticus]MCI9702470.1 glycosyltransferase family 2 protein [Vibrio parahaemolyticus]
MFTSKVFELTIITPVYNRLHLINRMANNFSKIDYKGWSIQWIIIDDGSEPELSLTFDMPESINVEIIRQENAGKHVAINTALPIANGLFTIIVDSDDFINQRQYENIQSSIKEYGDNYNGFIAYNENQDGLILGNLPRADKPFKKNDIFKIKGDYSRVVKTSIMSSCKFDVFDGEKFNTEINFWCKVHAKINFKVIEKAFVTIEYQPDGLSSKYHDLLRVNPKGLLTTINKIIFLGYDLRYYYKFICYHLSHLDNPYLFINKLHGLSFIIKTLVAITIFSLRMTRGK